MTNDYSRQMANAARTMGLSGMQNLNTNGDVKMISTNMSHELENSPANKQNILANSNQVHSYTLLNTLLCITIHYYTFIHSYTLFCIVNTLLHIILQVLTFFTLKVMGNFGTVNPETFDENDYLSSADASILAQYYGDK